MTAPRFEATSGFFLLLAWLNYVDGQGIVPACMLACGLHELGHYIVLRVLNVPVHRIRLTAVGAEMEVLRPLAHGEEGAAALAGPGINLMLALIFSRWERFITFAGINLALGCFNLLPVGGLDGGRALYATLSLMAGPELAYAVCSCVDRVLAGLLLMTGLLLLGAGGNVTLLLVALWLCAQPILSKGGNRACHGALKRVK